MNKYTNMRLISTEVEVELNPQNIKLYESLGYKSSDIKKVIPKIDNELSLENQIKEALKLLGK